VTTIELGPLVGTNPLAFLAALGAMDVVRRSRPSCSPTLRWTDGLTPQAVLQGPRDIDDLIQLCDSDRQHWLSSPLLSPLNGAKPPPDLRMKPGELRAWAAHVAVSPNRADADLFCALVSEGAVAGNGDTKPTHLDFTAGQQRFLDMLRHLASAVTPPDFDEALRGPWRYESTLPSLGWDSRGERIYALRGTDPAGEKRTGVPGADWLAFLGLAFFPVATSDTSLLTTGCSEAWKRGWFRWPLWSPPIEAKTIRSLVGDPTIATESTEVWCSRGLSMVLEAPIRRSAQGGYGSFGPATRLPG
jgi:hypothetical protein